LFAPFPPFIVSCFLPLLLYLFLFLSLFLPSFVSYLLFFLSSFILSSFVTFLPYFFLSVWLVRELLCFFAVVCCSLLRCSQLDGQINSSNNPPTSHSPCVSWSDLLH
jgi:hypothetical protein